MNFVGSVVGLMARTVSTTGAGDDAVIIVGRVSISVSGVRLTALRKALANAPADLKRFSGFFARAVCMMSSTSIGSAGCARCSDGGASCRWLVAID